MMGLERFMASALLAAILILTEGGGKVHGANIGIWSPGTRAATPAPVTAERLELLQEHVIFRDGKITGRFLVRNPGDLPLRTPLVFPLDAANRERPVTAGMADELLAEVGGPPRVTVNGTPVQAVWRDGSAERLPGGYTWDMELAAGGTAEIGLTYIMQPFFSSEGDRGASFRTSEFVYSPFAPAWRAPVRQASFEYCDPQLVRLMLRFPQNGYETWSEDGYTVSYLEWRVVPESYRLDLGKGCIVWERTDWPPAPDRDDIHVFHEESSQTFRFSCEAECNGLGDMESIWANWCGSGPVGTGRHLGDLLGIGEKPLPENLSRLLYDAYVKGHPVDGSENHRFYLPRHLEADLQRNLFRYLRNYIAARHGHRFRDPRLAACYGNLSNGSSWSAVERRNLERIKVLEKSAGGDYEQAWRAVREQRVTDRK